MKWFTKTTDPQFEKNMRDTYKNNNNVPDSIKTPIETPKEAPQTVKEVIEREKANAKKSVSTPKPVTEEKKPVEKKSSIVEDSLTTAKENKKEEAPKDMVNTMLSSIDAVDPIVQGYGERFNDRGASQAATMADRTTKDNISRLAKYLGGGIVGQIADTVGIYGDMMSTAKHNLAQAYFQAAGKGGQYKDPLSREILSKKVNTMIDSIAGAIKENNTKQTDEGFRILGLNNDEAQKIYGEGYKVVGKYMALARTKEEAILMGDFCKKLQDDPRWKDPNYKLGIMHAMNDPEERLILVGAMNGDPQIAQDYLLNQQLLAQSDRIKAMTEAEVAQKTKDSQIFKTNMGNNAEALYNKLKANNVDKMFDIELQNLIDGARILHANAGDAEIDNRINAFSEKWKKYGVVRDQIAGTVKDTVGVVKDVVGAVTGK